MKQDIERTNTFFNQASDELTFPVVAYVETPDEEILSVAFLLSPTQQTSINKGSTGEFETEDFLTKKSDIMRRTPGSQSQLTMFVLGNALPSDIERIRQKALAYKDRPLSKTTEKTKP